MKPNRLGVATALVLALGAGTACTANPPAPGAPTTPAVAASFGPGADGIGDPYLPKAGNGGYDVGNYDLDVRYEPATDVLTGTAVISATATANLSAFNLDFRGMQISSLTVGEAAATSSRSGDELTVTPAAPIAHGSQFVIKVQYAGKPVTYKDGSLETGVLPTTVGAIIIGEPDVAASWFPVNDHPRDKATFTIKITAPDGLNIVSNGVRTASTSAGGQTTATWRVNKPMAPYLAMAVIGKYRVTETVHNGVPVVVAVDTALPTRIDTTMARTGEVIDFLATKFGPYPFDAAGGIVINDQLIQFTDGKTRGLGFALENQTRPIYSRFFFNGDGSDIGVLVHELGHQWFGDSVAVNGWKEIWLNEGFATYAAWLWSEAHGNPEAQSSLDRYLAQPNGEIWSVKPGDPGPNDVFNRYVYDRGGLTLHALRITVGDDAFFAIIKAWAAEKADGNATTAEFIALAERISGKQLKTLFDDWLYQTDRPARPTRAA